MEAGEKRSRPLPGISRKAIKFDEAIGYYRRARSDKVDAADDVDLKSFFLFRLSKRSSGPLTVDDFYRVISRARK